MKPYCTNDVSTLYRADAREIPLPDISVHCVVTSPPYWGLRDYGLGQWQGGDAECGHKRLAKDRQKEHGLKDRLPGTAAYGGNAQEAWPNNTCGLCGAVNTPAGIGLEPTLGEWVQNVVEVMREVKRVLRDDGTCWLNLGDAYSSNPSNGRGGGSTLGGGSPHLSGSNRDGSGLPLKNLMGQPWRVAFALQDDGWILRSAPVWHKPNPMPESATDRPTSSYEMVFLLAKSGSPTFWTHQDGYGSRTKPAPDYRMVNGKQMNMWRAHDYFYDAEAIRTSWSESSVQRLAQPTFDSQKGGPKDPKAGNRSHRKVLENLKRRQPAGWATSPSYDEQDPRYQGRERGDSVALPHSGANARNVWTIATQPRKDAHFATFPDALPRRCILAGTSEKGVCGECGAPWVRQVVSTPMETKPSPKSAEAQLERGVGIDKGKTNMGGTVTKEPTRQTLGWQPTCTCNAAVVPATVLDPFVGSGTTVAVAQALGRRGVGLDLNEEYLGIAAKRIGSVPLPLTG